MLDRLVLMFLQSQQQFLARCLIIHWLTRAWKHF